MRALSRWNVLTVVVEEEIEIPSNAVNSESAFFEYCDRRVIVAVAEDEKLRGRLENTSKDLYCSRLRANSRSASDISPPDRVPGNAGAGAGAGAVGGPAPDSEED